MASPGAGGGAALRPEDRGATDGVSTPTRPAAVGAHRTGPGTQRLFPAPPPATGTANWSEDYFSSTSGVGLVVSQRASATEPGQSTVQEELRQLFERDWSSRYAVGLDGQAQGQDCAWQD